jgi:hypothetical protein
MVSAGYARERRVRRTSTVVIKSLKGGPSSNQIEDANTKGAVKSAQDSPPDVQPDRGRVKVRIASV